MTANRDQPTDPKKQGLRPGPDTDPDATISGPLSRVDDPDATISGPLSRVDDPDATISGPLAPRDDPDATVTGPMAALMKLGDQDPEDTLKPQPRVDDPEDTFNGAFADFDPDATVSTPTVMRRRANPFAPKALPEALQANLAALGGLNPLIAYANPILSAVPQIRESLQHPAPELLMETLEDLVEAFEAGAANSGTPDAVVEASIYALCCMVDDAAAATTWGRDWETTGLLQKLRGESNGGEQFFSLLADMSKSPEDNAELLELMYVCLALGFEGRFRGVDGGAAQLGKVRTDLHALVSERRALPSGGLSARWRGATPGSLPKKTAPVRPAKAAPSGVWRVAAGAVVAGLVLFLGYTAFEKPAPAPVSAPAVAVQGVTPAKVELPATVPSLTPHKKLEQALAADVRGGVVALSEKGGRSVVELRNTHQFASGHVEPDAEALAAITKLSAVLEGVPGSILVRGYTDTQPLRTKAFASNLELSTARAEAVAKVLAAKLSDPARVKSEGAGEADPIAPNDTETNRARNRRMVIYLGSTQ